jgi:hypothetical protein
MMRSVVALVALAGLLALPLHAQAQSADAPSTPDRNPFRAKAPAAAEAPAAKPVLPGEKPTVAWSDTDVTAAKLACDQLLAGLTLEYEPLPPLKEGICGAPAPILVKSIGGVKIEPAATMTCALAKGLSAWIDTTLQPRANALLGSRVVTLHNATSYSCRNRYGGENTPLSEHALANALDISEFVFQSGAKVAVLSSWPRVVNTPPAPLPNPVRPPSEITGSVTPATAPSPKPLEIVAVTKAKADIDPKTNPFAVTTKAKTNPFALPAAAVKAPPPAPPPVAAAPAAPAQPIAERQGEFVKAVHDDACDTFGTVLGPEANEAHKNHFHFDMKARRHKAICE